MSANDDLNQKVTERIQDQLLMILPEEEIRKRVDQVIDNFFSPSKDQYNRVEPSAFTRMVNKHLEAKANELIANLFQSEQWKTTLNSEMQLTMGSAVQTILGIDPNGLSTIVAKIIAAKKASDLLMLAGMHILNKNFGQMGMELHNALMEAASQNYEAATDPAKMNQMVGQRL